MKPISKANGEGVGLGRLRKNRMMAAVEPRHGNEVVVYTQSKSGAWQRKVVFSDLEEARTCSMLRTKRANSGITKSSTPSLVFWRVGCFRKRELPAAHERQGLIYDRFNGQNAGGQAARREGESPGLGTFSP